MNSPGPPQTISQLLREGGGHTDRDLMRALSMSHPKLKSCEADPSLFTLRDLVLLAALVGRPVGDVVKIALVQAEHNPEVVEEREKAKSQIVGRKRQPRKPKGEVSL